MEATTSSRHPVLRWGLAFLGWACWFASMLWPTKAPPAKPLISIYPDVYKVYVTGEVIRIPMGIQVAIHLFVAGTALLALSPLLMVLFHRGRLLRFRWLGWSLLSVGPMLSWMIARLGWLPSLCIFGLANLVVCAALVRWPGDPEPDARGFDVLPAASRKTRE